MIILLKLSLLILKEVLFTKTEIVIKLLQLLVLV